MQIKFHQGLTIEEWSKNNVFEMMGNIGSEVSRSIKWKKLGNEKMWQAAFYRSLELFDLTKEITSLPATQKNEINRSREVWCDFLVGDNVYGSTSESIQKYFDQFAVAARNVAKFSKAE